MNKIKEYIKLIRVKHYFKNVLIFLPLIFSGNIFNIEKLIISIIGFIAFSFVASVVYIINDIRDIENDRKHPIKRKRPLPAGTVSQKEAIILAIVMLLIAYLLNTIIFVTCNMTIQNLVMSMILLSLYILLNIAYSFGLKNKPVTNIEVSNWLYLTVISGSFYMGLGKRRNEIKKQGDKSREVLKRYSKEFLDKNMYVCLTLSIVFYALWCVDSATIQRMGTNLMVWTVPIVMIILMKYSLDVEGDSYGDPVDVLFKDKILLLIVALYAISVFSIMYLL